MNAPIVVFVSTVYLYSISQPASLSARNGGLLEIPYKVYFQTSRMYKKSEDVTPFS